MARRMYQKTAPLPLGRTNWILMGCGVALLVVGYFFLSIGPWDSFWSLTLAPILLVAGYCVVIPWAILYRPRSREK